MEVEYRLDWTDYAALQRVYFTRGGRRWWLSWSALWLGVFALIAVEHGRQFLLAPDGPKLRLWTFFLPAMLGFAWLLSRVSTWNAGRELARRGSVKLGVAPDGLSITSANFQGFMKWPGIRRIEETPAHAFFFESDKTAYILPARAFPSAVEFRTFVGLARRYKEQSEAPKPPPPPGPSDAITRPTDFTA